MNEEKFDNYSDYESEEYEATDKDLTTSENSDGDSSTNSESD